MPNQRGRSGSETKETEEKDREEAQKAASAGQSSAEGDRWSRGSGSLMFPCKDPSIHPSIHYAPHLFVSRSCFILICVFFPGSRVIRLLLLSPCSSWSVPGGSQRAHTSRTRGSGFGRGAEEPRPQAARPLLQGADDGAGAALPRAALPVCPGAGTPGGAHSTHPQPGEDLVPEPPLQDEAVPRGAESGRAATAAAPPRRHPGPGAGGEASGPGLGGGAPVRPGPAAVRLLSAAAAGLRAGAAAAAAAAATAVELLKRQRPRWAQISHVHGQNVLFYGLK